MGKPITNDKMAMILVSFWSNDDGEEEYDDFRDYWKPVMSMAVARYSLGWVKEITPAGYEQISLAFAELVALGYVDDEGNLLDSDGYPIPDSD
jgi:hypothetical protein